MGDLQEKENLESLVSELEKAIENENYAPMQDLIEGISKSMIEFSHKYDINSNSNSSPENNRIDIEAS